ncbi:MAG: hypothetical protein U1E92_00200 [Moraxella osloensis]
MNVAAETGYALAAGMLLVIVTAKPGYCAQLMFDAAANVESSGSHKFTGAVLKLGIS